MKKTVFILFIVGFSKIFSQTISVVSGSGSCGFTGDNGQATSAKLCSPDGIAIDVQGNIYIADRDNKRIRKIDNTGIITTIAGNGTVGYGGDNGPASSSILTLIAGLTSDNSGNLYIADYYNNRIRKINSSGIITTIAGNGSLGFSGDGGPAISASLNTPYSVAFDASGNMYIADEGNARIRKVNTSGIITTVAGNGTQGFGGDGGQATSAQLNYPDGVAFDASGNMYIADTRNYRIRKVNSSGNISTYSGNGTSGNSGDGGPVGSAVLNTPMSLAFDASGNLYIADGGVRFVNTAGIINTITGSGWALTCDGTNNLYIADLGNHQILKIANANTTNIDPAKETKTNLVIHPNPTIYNFFIETNSTEKQNIQLFDVNGRLVLSQNIMGNTEIDVSQLDNGIYTLVVKVSTGYTNHKVVIAN